jgi:hypothetical protein
MKKTLRNRDKRIAVLLITAFAWLFIGSLIIFHQEHVLGKHIRLNSHFFISPKSKDKQGLTVKLLKPVLKLYDKGGSDGIQVQDGFVAFIRDASEIKPKGSSSFHPDESILNNFPLRGPPVS